MLAADAAETNPAARALLWAVRIGLALVMLTPLVVTTDTVFPYVVGKALYARAVIAVTFALWLPLIFFYPRWRPRFSWVIAAFALWLAVSAISAFTGVSPARSLWSTYERMQGVVDLAHWFVFALMLASSLRSFLDWSRLFTVGMAVSLATALLGLTRVFAFAEAGAGIRLDATLGNPSYVAAYALTHIIIGLALLAHSFSRTSNFARVVEIARDARFPRPARRRQSRGPLDRAIDGGAEQQRDHIPWLQVFWAAAIAANLVVLWFAGSRAGVVALFAAAIFFSASCLLWTRMRIARPIAVATMCAAVLSAAAIGAIRIVSDVRSDDAPASFTMTERVVAVGLDDWTLNTRVLTAAAGARAFMDMPAFGWGPENFIAGWGRYINLEIADIEHFDKAHNKIVEELATKGIAGLASYMMIWLAMAWGMRRLIRRARGYAWLAALIISSAMIAYFAHNLFLFDTTVSTMHFCLFVAFAASGEIWTDRRRRGDSERAPRPPRPAASRAPHPAARCAAGVALCVGAVALAAALIAVNARIYIGARGAADFVASQGQPWADRADIFRGAVNAFPPLANIPRRYLFTEARAAMRTLPDDEHAAAESLVAQHARAAMQSEPRNWRIALSIISFYHKALDRNVDSDARSYYIRTARLYLDEALALAPKIATDSFMHRWQRYQEGEIPPPEPDLPVIDF